MSTPDSKKDEWFWVLQYSDTLPTEGAADNAVLALAELDGFIAGRSVRPSPSKPGWRVQAFFEDASATLDMSRVPHSGPLPDCMRRVITRPSMIESLFRRSR
jgi:hypothetical protein